MSTKKKESVKEPGASGGGFFGSAGSHFDGVLPE